MLLPAKVNRFSIYFQLSYLSRQSFMFISVSLKIHLDFYAKLLDLMGRADEQEFQVGLAVALEDPQFTLNFF